MKAAFKNRTFESEIDTLETFKGYNDFFCIEFNAKCIHSVKTEKQHIKKLNELIKKHNLIEVQD